MKLEEIKKDLELIEEYNNKRRVLGNDLNKVLRRTHTYTEYQKELQKQSWAGDYEEIVKKYEHIFESNSVWINDYECSPLEDFLKITIALMENNL